MSVAQRRWEDDDPSFPAGAASAPLRGISLIQA